MKNAPEGAFLLAYLAETEATWLLEEVLED